MDEMGPGKVLFLEFAPLGARAMFFSSVGASGTVVAHGATGSGDCDGFAFLAAGKASVFEDLLDGNPDVEGFAYAIPIVVR